MARRLTISVLKKTVPSYNDKSKCIEFTEEDEVIMSLSPEYIIGDYVVALSSPRDDVLSLYSIKTDYVFSDLDMSSFTWFINTALSELTLLIDGVPMSAAFCGLYWEDHDDLYVNDKKL